MCSFAKFLSVNGLKKKDIALYLGVSNAFISQLCSGSRPLPSDKLALIKANPEWDTSMLGARELHLPIIEARRESRKEQTSELVQSAIENVLGRPAEEVLIEYLQEKVSDQEKLIHELYQKIGALEAQIELARKGEIARTAVGSSDANAV